jgi:hypothetical protein
LYPAIEISTFWVFSMATSARLTFLSPITGKIAGGNTSMLVERGKSTYVYSTQRVNGKPVTRYIGKSSSPQAQEYAKSKEETQQHRQREQDLAQLQQTVNQALRALDMMKRAQLLLIGVYARRSELRTLQEEALCHTTMN